MRLIGRVGLGGAPGSGTGIIQEHNDFYADDSQPAEKEKQRGEGAVELEGS